MKKEFWKYVIPSMITFLVTGIYVSVDGFFVGRTVGDIGLASVALAWPIASLILAVGTGIGMGGAVNVSVHMGAADKEKADKAFGNTITALLIASVALTIILLLLGRPILRLLGAEGELLELSSEYVYILAGGAVFQVFGTGITPLLRNQNKAWIAMVLMVTNFAIDTTLSGVFVMFLKFGVAGAAWATLIGQCIALVPAMFILFQKENRISVSAYKPNKEVVGQIIKVGAPIVGLSFIPSLTTLIMNKQALAYGGTVALAAFAAISNTLTIGQLLLQGIGEGSQPLISYQYGANNYEALGKLRKWTYTLAVAIGGVATIGMILARTLVPKFFGISEEATNILQTALPLCALSLPFYAFSRVTTECFNAIKKSRNAAIMVYGEALILLPLCAFIMPMLLKLNGVWVTLMVVQFLLLLIGLFLGSRNRKELPQ